MNSPTLISLPEPAQRGQSVSGVRVVEVCSSAHPPEIEAGDLLRIDFAQRVIGADGFYALSCSDWSGVRRFARTPRGLRMLESGAWRDVTPKDLENVEVTGRVLRIFKPRVVA